MIKRLLLLIVLCPVLRAANDFSGDGNCVALYRFEDGALTVETLHGNHLFTVNTPAADTVNFQEGACSVDLESGDADSFYRNNADLLATFPGKSGTANQTFSLCCWFKLESLPSTSSPQYGYRWIAGVGGTDKYSWNVKTNEDSGSHYAMLGIGYNSGVNLEIINHSTALSIATWYHLGVTFDNSDKSYRIRLWDGASAVEVTGTATNTMNVENGAFNVGSLPDAVTYQLFDGPIDELAIFNDVLTQTEIDEIETGTYPTAGGGGAGQVIIIE